MFVYTKNIYIKCLFIFICLFIQFSLIYKPVPIIVFILIHLSIIVCSYLTISVFNNIFLSIPLSLSLSLSIYIQVVQIFSSLFKIFKNIFFSKNSQSSWKNILIKFRVLRILEPCRLTKKNQQFFLIFIRSLAHFSMRNSRTIFFLMFAQT